MEEIDLQKSIDDIVKELDDKNLLYMSSGKIMELKNNVLQKMYLTKEQLKIYHKKLKDYMYVDELQEITVGSYVRWFNLNETDLDKVKLNIGGFVVDFNKGQDDIHISYKNLRNKYYTFPMNKSIIFKKLTNQEKLLIKIIDHINK